MSETEISELRQRLQIAESQLRNMDKLRSALKRAAVALLHSEEFQGANAAEIQRINEALK